MRLADHLSRFAVLAALMLAWAASAHAGNWEYSLSLGQASNTPYPPDTTKTINNASWKLEYVGPSTDPGTVKYRFTGFANLFFAQNGQITGAQGEVRCIVENASGYIYVGQTIELAENTEYLVNPCMGPYGYSTFGAQRTTFRTNKSQRAIVKPLKNDGSVPMRVQIFDGDKKIYDAVLQPGDETNVKLTSESGNDLKVLYELQDVALDENGNLVSAPGQNLGFSETINRSEMTATTTGMPSSSIDSAGVGSASGVSGTPTGGTAQVVVGAVTPVTTSQPNNGLTEGTYVSGVNKTNEAITTSASKIVDALAKIQRGSSGGSSGGNVDVTPIVAAANNTTAAVQSVKTSVDAVKTSVDDMKDAVSGLAGFLRAGEGFVVGDALATAQNMAAAAPTYSGAKPQGTTVSVSGVGGSVGELGKISIGGHEVVLTLVPASVWSGADSLLRSCRSLVLFAAVIGFCWSCANELSKFVIALPTVQAADAGVGVENLVPGIAQGKAWGAAGVAVGIIVAAVAAMVAILDGWLSAAGVGIGTLFSAVNLSSVGAGLSLLDAYLPVTALAQLAILRAGFPVVIGPLYLGAAATLKFVKV